MNEQTRPVTKMLLDTVHVYIEYRCKSGPGEHPRDKRLRARVRYMTPEGWHCGVDILSHKRVVLSLDNCERICTEALAEKCRVIVFDYDDLLGQHGPNVRKMIA
jgi:hypothetical protein